jgi:hypothetical protein
VEYLPLTKNMNVFFAKIHVVVGCDFVFVMQLNIEFNRTPTKKGNDVFKKISYDCSWTFLIVFSTFILLHNFYQQNLCCF